MKIGFEVENCVRFASTFNVERVAVLTYDLVICKDSNDCLNICSDDFFFLPINNQNQNVLCPAGSRRR